MGYPHAPHHHAQNPMSIGNGLEPKFPPIAEDYHHYNGHYGMSSATHPHAAHHDLGTDYMSAASIHHHHSNNAISAAHHQSSNFNFGASPSPHHHSHHHHQSYYGHSSATVHHHPAYSSHGTTGGNAAMHSTATGNSSGYSNSSPNISSGNSVTASSYYGGYYSNPTGHSPHQMLDLPLHCPNVEPTNTVLGLQELGGY